MIRIFNKSFSRHFRIFLQPAKKRNFNSDQSKYHYLLNRLRDKREDVNAQREILSVLVRTIENEHQSMETLVKDEAVNAILEVQHDVKELDCPIVEDDCRLGLALLGYCPPLQTEHLRVLSIDGGGIRGIVVIELMKRLEEMTNKKIFELFDFICGVSTGSILICGLAAKPRTLSEGINLYKDVARKVFHRPGTFEMFTGTLSTLLTHAYYDVDLWDKLLREHMTDTRIIDTSKFKRVPKFCCVSTTVSEDSIDAHVFRNYVLPSNVESIYPGSHSAALWEVVRCSSAAPTYFGDFILDNLIHQDGGILYNNPSCVAIHEAKLLWPNQKICLVSMGTGRSLNKKKIDSQKLYSLKQVSKLFNGDVTQTSSWKMKFMRILDAATDTEQAHHILSDLMPPGNYFRFNPYLTEMISMTECDDEKLRQIEKDALMYFRRNEDKFEELADALMKPRTSISMVNDFINRRLIL